MTDSEWLTSDNLAAMVEWIRRGIVAADDDYPPNYPHCPVRVSDRKLRLFAVACWRRCPSWRPTTVWGEALLQLEELADGKREDFSRDAEGYICGTKDVDDLLRHLSGLWEGRNLSETKRERNRQVSAALLRDICGNPWRPVMLSMVYRTVQRKDTRRIPRGAHPMVPVSPTGLVTRRERYCPWLTWNDGLIPRLARDIYDSRDFERMPMLSDMLLDSGCDNEALMQHCREPGVHVRGCWALDLLTGNA